MNKFLKSTVRGCIAILGFSLASAGCKPKSSESSLQSLDNFTAGTRLQLNECRGDPSLLSNSALISILNEMETRVVWSTAKSAAERAPLMTAMRAAFAALPPSMQMQFLGMGGQILVTGGANAICGDSSRKALVGDKSLVQSERTALQEGMKSISSCYLFLLPGDKASTFGVKTANDKPSLIAVLSDDKIEISHTMVRVFAYMNAMLSSHMRVGGGNFLYSNTVVAFTDTENPNFQVEKVALAKAYLADIKGTANYAKFAKFDVGGNATPAERGAFAQFLYAEAYDSYFCNQTDPGKNTMNRFAKQFPKAFGAFVASLAHGPPKGAKLTTPAQASASGLRLWSLNPVNWVKGGYNSYITSRNAIIDNLTEATMSNNGGKMPTTYETLSIAANGAWRPVKDAPLLNKFVAPAVDAADAIGGATINNDGSFRALSDGERQVRVGTGIGQAVLANGASEAVVNGVVNRLPSVGVATAIDSAIINSSTGRAAINTLMNVPGGKSAVGTFLKEGSQIAEDKLLSTAANTAVAKAKDAVFASAKNSAGDSTPPAAESDPSAKSAGDEASSKPDSNTPSEPAASDGEAVKTVAADAVDPSYEFEKTPTQQDESTARETSPTTDATPEASEGPATSAE